MKKTRVIKRRPWTSCRPVETYSDVRLSCETGCQLLPKHWSSGRDAAEIARIRAELLLEERLMMLGVRYRIN